MICDGCHRELSVLEVRLISAIGHTMRYCDSCAEMWDGFRKACEAEGQRMQRLLDLWELDTRANLPLKLTPLDLPKVMANRQGNPIVLG